MNGRTPSPLMATLVAAVVVVGGCSGQGGPPDIAARVEGTEIPAAQTEALLQAHVSGQEVDGDRKDSLTHFVLLYQIKHAVLRHLAQDMDLAVEPDAALTPEAEAGRLSQAIAERLFPNTAEEQRHALFLEWFDKQLREAKVWVDGHFGRWDAGRGVVQ